MKTYSGQLREESPDYQVDEKLLLLEREESPGSNSGKEGTVSNNDVLDRYGYGRYLHSSYCNLYILHASVNVLSTSLEQVYQAALADYIFC